MADTKATKGIELLTSFTPNGFKVSILLEELKEAYGLDYSYQLIDIFERNEQKQPWFTKLNPNGRIPIIIDHDNGDFAVMETMTIMNYLTREYDREHKFSFKDTKEHCVAEQWCAWVHGGLALINSEGPMQAQANFYYRFSPVKHPFALQKYYGETERLWGVLDTQLKERDYIAGPDRGTYSIADMAAWPFIESCFVTGIDMKKFPSICAWWKRIGERPAVQHGMMVPLGTEFRFGYDLMQRKMQDDAEAMETVERPLRDALAVAQNRFGYVFTTP